MRHAIPTGRIAWCPCSGPVCGILFNRSARADGRTVLERRRLLDGYTLFAPLLYGTTYLIDNGGMLIHSWDSGGGLSAYMLSDGSLIRTNRAGGNSTFTAGGATGIPGDPLLGPIPAAPGYHSAFDRGGQLGANGWNQAPADGGITIVDIFAVAGQFGHTCG